ncbi:hypothetical protein H1R20_g4598, partial [Candolleomyces eurysporus]
MLPRIVTALLCIVGLVTSANGTPVSEGRLDFRIPSTGEIGKTWYRIIGNLKPGVRPLIALHGGPGVNSGYLEALAPVTKGRPGPLIVYDQIGNGKSTHYPERMGNTTFWTEQLFLAELDNVLKKLKITEYDLIGHSWGAMLGAMHAVEQPKGLKHLVLWSGPASMALWIEAQRTWISQLPPAIRDALIRGEETGETDTEEYENASNYFYSKHFCRLDPFPPSLLEGFAAIENDPTVYLTMSVILFIHSRLYEGLPIFIDRNGPSEFTITGSLRNWTIIPSLPKIKAPTLVTNGRYDEAADIVVKPFVQKIPNVRWVSHTALFEEPDKYKRVLKEFLYN